MRRSVLISFLSLLLVCICVSSGLADARKLNLIFIGGDSDTEEGKNNLFRNMMISHEAFQEGAEAFFIKSAGRDYSNAAAIERTKAAEALLESLRPRRAGQGAKQPEAQEKRGHLFHAFHLLSIFPDFVQDFFD